MRTRANPVLIMMRIPSHAIEASIDRPSNPVRTMLSSETIPVERFDERIAGDPHTIKSRLIALRQPATSHPDRSRLPPKSNHRWRIFKRCKAASARHRARSTVLSSYRVHSFVLLESGGGWNAVVSTLKLGDVRFGAAGGCVRERRATHASERRATE